LRTSDRLDGLSDDAKSVASHHLAGMRPGIGTIAFASPYRISRRAKAALDELVRARVLTVGPFGEGGLVYRLVADCSAYRGWLDRHPEAGKFTMVDDQDPCRCTGYTELDGNADLSSLLVEYADRIPADVLGAAVAELLSLGDPELRGADAVRGIDGHSLLAFLDYLVMSIADDVPSLGLDTGGLIIAAWASQKGLLSARFAERVSWDFRCGGDALSGTMDLADFAQLAERLLPRIRD